ncbi:hypothetical protein P7C71_g4723, partial [Lecanoromycetidae sp. Uapishka_2]
MSLTSIAKDILVQAERLDAYAHSSNLPPASFAQDVFADLPAELEETRRALVDSTQILKDLAQGPAGQAKDILFGVGMMTCELGPAFNKYIEAQSKWPNSDEPHETAWCVEHDTSLSVFEFLGKNPDRARRFGAGMRYFTKDEVWDLKYLHASYDWVSIDRPGTVMVDVGGGQGGVAQFLAKLTKHLKIYVQDLPATAEQGFDLLPDEFKDRIEFVANDFFFEQTIKDADVYFFRWILHNWSDKYAIRILQALTPALKNGARILVYEVVLSDKPDWSSMQKAGFCERNEDEWNRLFKRADWRFTLKGVTTPKGSMMSLIEVVWEA